MKVLQINAVNEISSTGRSSLEIANYLNQHGHEGYIAYSAGTPYHKGYKIGNKLDTKIHGLLSRILGTQAYFSYFATKRLLKYIDHLKPDIVHLRNLHGNYIHLPLLLNYLAKNDISTVITLHDCWFYTGKCTYYTAIGCNKWQEVCEKCPKLKNDNPSWFFDRTKKMFEDKKRGFSKISHLAVVGVSDWITNEAKKSFLSSAKIITRIYNWIDLDVFKPAETANLRNKLKLNNKFIIIGVASHWSNAKGLNKFLQLATMINNDTIILLVGSLPKKIKLPFNIIHINETHSTNELAQYYSMADVYLHLSIEETFGKTIAEALACGTPVVAINSTAIPEIVGQGCGYLVDNNNLNKIHDAIQKIKQMGKSYYSKNCINHVQMNFNKDTLIKAHLKLYHLNSSSF